jgi:hypothetical protein
MRKLTLEGKRANYNDRNGKKVFGKHLMDGSGGI